MMEDTYYIGIDIAKAKFDMAFINHAGNKTHKVFQNNQAGFETFFTFLQSKKITKAHIVMEATNVYWHALAKYCLEQEGVTVSVVNPVQIASYAKCQLQRGKTDKVDAFLLARFAQNEQPNPWQPLSKEHEQLLKLVRQSEHLKTCLQKEQVRLQTADDVVQPSIEAVIQCLAEQVNDIDKQIQQHIKSNDTLLQGAKLLKSIPGVGDKTIPWLLATLENGQRFKNSKQATCYMGLTPRPWQSGSSIKGRSRISKVGPSDVRKILYMPAVVVSYGSHKHFQPFVKRLENNGKTKMEVIVAVMRKIVAIAQAVLKTQTAYNPKKHAN